MLKSETIKKLEKLRKFLGSFKNAVIAFSGGVDSATLTAICKEEIEEVLAVTIKTKAIPSREIENAKKIAIELGVKHEFLDLDILGIKEFVENSKDRCYYCKKYILKSLLSLANNRGFEIVFEGTNSSDLKGDRAGFRAVLEESKVLSPWVKFEFEKEEIRAIAKSMGFSFHDHPAIACLATRIPYGFKITAEALERIDLAENNILRLFGVKNVRVRDLKGIAIVEVNQEDLWRFLDSRRLLELRKGLHELGFHSVLLDLDGYSEGGAKKYSAFSSSDYQH
ncbi:MAG: ATP-dependent sacrificial sulfur transferase LarE [Archaeoglobaceae archaeon]|nr:ATP-dependent sacrificial sulfur transferase LarE [Archaeoglobaceae archaeon]MDW8127802.1 ATP-dependent sacrificial sulfur transferase LarE [Archaeoglobaceae archaeon]